MDITVLIWVAIIILWSVKTASDNGRSGRPTIRTKG